MRSIRTAALIVVAIALFAAPQTASAGQTPTLFFLSGNNGYLTAEWFLQPGAPAWLLETAPIPTEGPDGFWVNDTRHPLQPGDVSAKLSMTGGTHWARVISTTTLEVCKANPVDPQCDRQFSNAGSVLLLARVNGSPTLTGVSQAGGVISAGWNVPAGGESWEVQVSTSPERRVSGYFVDETLSARVPRGTTSFTFPAADALSPGTYYVQVFTTPLIDDCEFFPYDPANCVFDYSNILPITVTPGGSSAPPLPAAPGASASDKVLSLGAITASSSQKFDKLGITLKPGEAVSAKLSGTVSVPGGSKVFRFKSVSKSIGAGVKTKLSLRLPKKGKKAVKKALKRKKKLKAKLTLLITDAAGNAQTKKYSVRLKP